MINQHSIDAIQQDWMKKGVCTDPTIDPDWFFPESEHNKNTEVQLALSMCIQCPVRINCLQYAIDSWPIYGIWGGLRNKQIKEMVERMEASK